MPDVNLPAPLSLTEAGNTLTHIPDHIEDRQAINLLRDAVATVNTAVDEVVDVLGGITSGQERTFFTGMYAKPSPISTQGIIDTQAALRAIIGDYPIIHTWFYGSSSTSVITAAEQWALAEGAIPMISWNPGSTSSIANGSTLDAKITTIAKQIAAFPGKIIIRAWWEPDVSSVQPDAGTPANFIAAWQKVVGIFRTNGATNAEFAWCTTAYGFKPAASPQATTFYPGDTWVDWIMSDGYQWEPTRGEGSWQTPTTIFSTFYDWAKTKGKPIGIGEFACVEDPAVPGRKAQWLDQFLAMVKTWVAPKVAVVGFHSIKTETVPEPDITYEWIFTSSTTATEATKRLVAASEIANPLAVEAIPVAVSIIGGSAANITGSSAAAVTEFATRLRTKIDLTEVSQVRLISRVMVAGGGSVVGKLQYSLDETTWTDLTPTVPANAVATAASAWATTPEAAKADVFVRMVSSGGDTVTAPQFGATSLQLR